MDCEGDVYLEGGGQFFAALSKVLKRLEKVFWVCWARGGGHPWNFGPKVSTGPLSKDLFKVETWALKLASWL